jgi:hypothetical protein
MHSQVHLGAVAIEKGHVAQRCRTRGLFQPDLQGGVAHEPGIQPEKVLWHAPREENQTASPEEKDFEVEKHHQAQILISIFLYHFKKSL